MEARRVSEGHNQPMLPPRLRVGLPFLHHVAAFNRQSLSEGKVFLAPSPLVPLTRGRVWGACVHVLLSWIFVIAVQQADDARCVNVVAVNFEHDLR